MDATRVVLCKCLLFESRSLSPKLLVCIETGKGGENPFLSPNIEAPPSLTGRPFIKQAGSIITVRFIMVIAATVISNQTGYYSSRPCEQLDFMFEGNKTATIAQFPDCAAFYSGKNPAQHTLVEANMDGDSAANVTAALGIGFGPAIWLSFAIHAVGVEIYVSCRRRAEYKERAAFYKRLAANGKSFL